MLGSLTLIINTINHYSLSNLIMKITFIYITNVYFNNRNNLYINIYIITNTGIVNIYIYIYYKICFINHYYNIF